MSGTGGLNTETRPKNRDKEETENKGEGTSNPERKKGEVIYFKLIYGINL